MNMYSGHINKLIEELAALPGIGTKSAQRLAFHFLNMSEERVKPAIRLPIRKSVPYVPMQAEITS